MIKDDTCRKKQQKPSGDGALLIGGTGSRVRVHWNILDGRQLQMTVKALTGSNHGYYSPRNFNQEGGWPASSFMLSVNRHYSLMHHRRADVSVSVPRRQMVHTESPQGLI